MPLGAFLARKPFAVTKLGIDFQAVESLAFRGVGHPVHHLALTEMNIRVILVGPFNLAFSSHRCHS